jgi:hypothetical protein
MLRGITAVAVIGLVGYWFAGQMQDSLDRNYRLGMLGAARNMITAQDSALATKGTFTGRIADLPLETPRRRFGMHIVAADSDHWVGSVGEPSTVGTCSFSATRRVGARPVEEVTAILDAAVCSNKKTAAWWRANR